MKRNGKSNDIGRETNLNLSYKLRDDISIYARLGCFARGKIWGPNLTDAKNAQIGCVLNF